MNLNVTGKIKNSGRNSSQSAGNKFQIGHKKHSLKQKKTTANKLDFIKIKRFSSKALSENVKKQAKIGIKYSKYTVSVIKRQAN